MLIEQTLEKLTAMHLTGGTPAGALEATITELARRNTREILAEAARTGLTPTAVAYDRVARRLAEQR